MQEPIAIIGTSCRLPGGINSPRKLWELLKHPTDLSSKILSSRFNPDAFYHPNPEHPGTSNAKKAYLLEDDPLVFDNDFFNISIREAESMDPQQRILLETVYEAIEASGYSMSQLKGSSTGVFVGQMTDDYRDLLLRDFDCHPSYTGTGIARSILANRVSYAFDWKGPSLNLDTACSSSLVALHQAVQSLRQGECDMAVVAGVNLVFGPETFSQLSSLRMLSPTGKCHMWDTRADGYARGEGFAAIVIKKLTLAIADGDDIETVVRNTGVNQDGQSSGLTVPSSEAQAELIRTTYKKGGLDCLKEEERCQYFEAHGTGTQAGDPKEAQGISMAFFPDHYQSGRNDDSTEECCTEERKKLYVGSIKTVIGHTEGAAGLASLLKASLAVRYGLIPPNLHFDRLNPSIEPYYHRLKVPVGPESWPQLPQGAPRRASVNSFGFGGTNAHAIVESWECQSFYPYTPSSSTAWGPFVLSANSKTALQSAAISLLEFLEGQTTVDLSRLAWTLQARRTMLKHRVSVSATSREQLIAKLESVIGSIDEFQVTVSSLTVPNVRVLGIFTGQGAQWALMGASLFQNSTSFRGTFEELDSNLHALPGGPNWSLVDALLHRDNAIAISAAEISQPLCTAVQIALVDLLQACGISFTAVIGHSSGEIAAAYAAGFLTASDAITIAYLRGYHCNQIITKDSGKMMAVGMAPEEARRFCQQQCFAGKLVVAAENSMSSTTLSGDVEAVEHAKGVLDKKKVFSKVLRTDTAYHSHHMCSVQEPYRTSLNDLGIKSTRNRSQGACNWYSTVYSPKDGHSMISPASLDGSYWAENLARPVLFSQAVIAALQENTFDLTLEIGPHPALRAPTTEIIRGFLGDDLPYVGLMERNKDSLETFSNALGTIWCHADSRTVVVDFAGFGKACDRTNWTMPRPYKDLAPYPWDHGRPMIRESKKSYLWRTRETEHHDLLGYPVSWADNEWRWRNILCLDDVDWLQSHRFQNQALLPASAYIVAAIDAALRTIGNARPVRMIELQDLIIHNGIAFEASSSRIELNFLLSRVEETEAGRTIGFSCRYSNADTASPDVNKEVVTGQILILLGTEEEDLLPSRIVPSLPMTNVATDRFYHWMDKIGLQYSGPFILESLKRRLDIATVMTTPAIAGYYVIHPGTLDSVFQGLYAAFSYPGDGRVWTTYLPKSCRRVRLDVGACRQMNTRTDSRLIADCFVTESSAREICGDIDVFCAVDGQAVVQIQGMVLSSLEVPSSANDRTVFWQTVWKQDLFSIAGSDEGQNHGDRSPEVCEKVAFSFLYKFFDRAKYHEMVSSGWYIPHLLGLASELAERESRPLLDSSNLHDRQSKNHKLTGTLEGDESSRQVDFELVEYVGSRLPNVLRSCELVTKGPQTDRIIEQIHTEGLGATEIKNHLGTIVDHLVHRYPGMRILELAAGTGDYTSLFLQHLGSNFEEYSFTDRTAMGFSAAQARFAAHAPTLAFQVLDIERPPIEQGFAAHAYDLVMAVRILSTTQSVNDALKHCRQLLRPGGYLIILEMTNPTALRNLFQLPLLPSWRLDQKQCPIITETQWEDNLRDALFSGVDVAFRDFESNSAHGLSVMVSQAVDSQILALRDPLTASDGMIAIKKLLIVGGRTLVVSQMASKMKSILRSFAREVDIIGDLGDASNILLEQGTAVICLCDLEEPTFRSMHQARISGMQTLFREAQYVLWVTRGSRHDDPYAIISVGIGRTALRELPHLRAKFVDFENFEPRNRYADATMLAEMLLRMMVLDLPDSDGILWSNETEVSVSHGITLIPRVRPHGSLNDRLNCSRREILTTLPLDLPPCSPSFQKGFPLAISGPNTPDGLTILSSSLVKLKCPDQDEPFHVCIAYLANEKRYILSTFSECGGMVTKVDDTCAPSWPQDIDPDELLSLILLILICESLLSDSTGTVWIHNADPGTCKALSLVADRIGTPIFLTTDSVAAKTGFMPKAIHVHPRSPRRAIKSLIPRSMKRFINMGTSTRTTSAIDFALNFPWHELDCRSGIHNVSVHEPFSLSIETSRISTVLSKYFAEPNFLHDFRLSAQNKIIKADQLHTYQQKTTIATNVVSWADVGSIRIPASPATDDQLFGPHKTYFLVGLTGEVGLSLCEWMINHGARHFALASRNPVVSPEMILHLKSKAATVRIFSLDVSDMDNLVSVHQEIASTMPPIGGVANGALVVRDHPFDGLSLDDLKDVFKPKVAGSQNLDDLFFSTPLDFFVLFSSMASIYGKPGQSSYNAANLFMSTLAEKRRNRGLAASTLHLGMMLGLGYIHGPKEATLEAKFRQEDLMTIPESEFHQIFSQAVLSGRPGPGSSAQLIAGLGTEVDTPWRELPMFAYCRLKRDGKNTSHPQRNKSGSAQNVQVTLKEASDREKALTILKEAIGQRIGSALGIIGESIDEDLALLSMGFDSLVAVEIRSWLLKTLEVNVPVLLFLNGSSLLEICGEVLGQLSDSLKAWDNDRPNDSKASKEVINDSDSHSEPIPPMLEGRVITQAGRSHHTINPEDAHQTPAAQSTQDQNGEQQKAVSEYERVGPMSHSQAQLYFLHEYLQNNAYNIAYYGTFHGRLNVSRLKESLQIVGKRHEGLRSAYFTDTTTSSLVQAVLSNPHIAVEQWAAEEGVDMQSAIDGVKDFRFDIENGAVMKVLIISHSPTRHSILFTHHHIALDGLSWKLFITDLAVAYSDGEHSMRVAPQPRQSIEMAKKQLGIFTHDHNLQSDLTYWRAIYKTIPQPLPLFPFSKTNNTRPASPKYNVHISNVKMSKDITRLVERAASKIDVTPMHFYLASFVTFLSRCLNVGDLAIGVVDANRREEADMGTIGHFLNMLPVRMQLSYSESFNTIARRARDAVVAAMAHSRAPFDAVLGELELSRSSSHHPLFQVAINYSRSPFDETVFGRDGKIIWDGGVPGGHPYDLMLNVGAMSDWTFLSLIAQHGLYKASEVALLHKWYMRALEALAHDPSILVASCPLSNAIDLEQALDLGRGMNLDVKWRGTLADRVNEIAASFPDSTAIIDEQGHAFTYSQVIKRTSQIAFLLHGVSQPLVHGSRVAMLLDPVADTVSCILAILGMGLTWIPLDTLNHHLRIRAIVEQCRPQVLLCHSSTSSMAREILAGTDGICVVNIDEAYPGIHVHGHQNSDQGSYLTKGNGTHRHEDHPAMILFTSGSTGVPKGVMLSHEGLMNQIYGTTMFLRLGRETTLQQSPLGFDLMLDQIFLALCNGGTVVVVGKEGRGDPVHIANTMVRHKVTLTHFVPSESSVLLNYGHHILTKTSSWRYAMSGGETLRPNLIKAFRKLDCENLELVNVYGPAEITLACARGMVPYREPSDVGDVDCDWLLPSPNYGIEIVDANMNALPVGFPGEICISGPGVGLGYVGRPAESEYSFVRREPAGLPTESVRIYRSGDMGMLLPDGTLKVLGRIGSSSQVKINGFRVELDEITNTILRLSNDAICSAAVSWRPSQSSGTLVAFVVFEINFVGDKSEFLDRLRANVPLPPYMKPRFIISIPRMPTTANGKIDRSAIDQLSISDLMEESTTNGGLAPTFSPGERAMKEIWEEVFADQILPIAGSSSKILEIRPSSDFFEVGGSSILMIKLKSHLRVHFRVAIPMPDLFRSSTLSAMSALVESFIQANETESPDTQTTEAFLRAGGAQQVLDWDLEIATMLDGLPQPRSNLPISREGPPDDTRGLIIVLTGATGFIGRHLLRQLVQHERVAQVYCIAIRPSSDGEPRRLPLQDEKVIEYAGDLSDINLGLSDADFASLVEHADAIIHNGADVSLLKTYSSLRRTNVLSTRRLCEMAIPRRVPVHYISTASVAKVTGHGAENPLAEVPAVPAAGTSLLDSVDGYAASKWASETLLEKIAADAGLPAYVHRLAHVAGEDASELDVVGMLTKYSLILRALPRIEERFVTGVWDFVAVGDVASDMVAKIFESRASQSSGIPTQRERETRVRFVNHCSDAKVPHRDLGRFLEGLAGGPLQEIGIREWVEAATEKGLHSLIGEFFIAFENGRGKLVLPVITKTKYI